MQSSLADNTSGWIEMNDAKDRSVLLDGDWGTGYACVWGASLLLRKVLQKAQNKQTKGNIHYLFISDCLGHRNKNGLMTERLLD